MERSSGGERKNWIWLICGAQVFFMMAYGNYVAALPIIQDEWHLTNAQAGTIYSAFYMGYVLASFFVATTTDYVNARTIYLVSAVWLGLTNLLFPVLGVGFWSGAFFRTMTGIGLAGTYTTGLRLLTEYAPGRYRARAVGVYAFFYTLGVAGSMYVTGRLVAQFGWRPAIAVTSLGPAVGFAVMAILLPKLPSPGGGERRRFELPRLSSAVWVAIVTCLLHRWEVFAFRGWAVTFFASAILVAGAEGKEAAVGLGASAAASVIALSSVSKLIGGWSADRFGRVPTIGLSLLLSGSLALFMGRAFALPYSLLLVVSYIWVVAMHIDAPVLIVLVSELAPRRHLGSAIGLQSGISFLFGSLSSVVVGVFLDWTNPGPVEEALPVHWGWAFTVPGAAALLGVVCTLWLSRLMRRERARKVFTPAA